MKALTVRQPHAGRIVSGTKPVEYRTWSTAYRGLLVIHAAKALDEHDCQAGVTYDVSCIVGAVDLVDVRDLGGGEWGWVLARPRLLLEPVDCSGRLGLWDVERALPPAVISKLSALW